MGSVHWDRIWESRAPEDVSWFQEDPQTSVTLIGEVSEPSSAVVDIGGGASRVVDRLLDRGYSDITVIDIADAALSAARNRIGSAGDGVDWVVADITAFEPERTFDVWHDRAVFHFLVDDTDRTRYLRALERSLRPGGHLVIATFGPDGPETCSGLPVRRYDPELMQATLGAPFHHLRQVSEAHRTPSGGIQHFEYGLYRYTAT